MAVENGNGENKTQILEQLYVPYSVATNMPFVTCDEETFMDQVWMYTYPEGVQEFAKKYEDKKIPFKGAIIKREHSAEFFLELHSMGVNEIVLCNGKTENKLELEKMGVFPDYSKLPEGQRPIFNPELQLSTIYFFQEVRREGVDPEAEKEKLEELAEEMYASIANSRFLMPVLMEEEEGKKKMRFPFLTHKNGQKFQPIFSDAVQYDKYVKKQKPDEATRVIMIDLEGLKKYLLSHVEGYMLNVEGYCHVLTKQQLEYISQRFKAD